MVSFRLNSPQKCENNSDDLPFFNRGHEGDPPHVHPAPSLILHIPEAYSRRRQLWPFVGAIILAKNVSQLPTEEGVY
jgi:hypothetical protein